MCSYTYVNNTWKIIITDIHSEWLRLTFGFDESSDAFLEIQVHNCGKSKMMDICKINIQQIVF